MEKYKKLGYLNSDFKMFHIIDRNQKEFHFHYHDFKKIVLFIQGNVTYSIEGKNYRLKPYDIILVDSGEIHRPVIHDSSTYERIIMYISPDFIQAYQEEEYDLSRCFQKREGEHSNVLRIESLKQSKLYQVSCELEQSFHDQAYASELYRKLLFLEFMICLNRAVITNHISYPDTCVSNQKIIQILEYINLHVKEEITIEQIARKFYLNRYYLMHLFKEETNYTIGNYITNKRLLLAKNFMQNGANSTEACYLSGFKNYTAFARAYKKNFHKTPRETDSI